MRRIRRPELSAESSQALVARTEQVLTAIDPKAEAQRLWRRDIAAIKEAATRLQEAASGPGRCMYCEGNEGRQIDHFWPKDGFPECTFVWENLVWSCDGCNVRKSVDFPQDAHGRPLLLDPTCEADIPRDHLWLAPTTGHYQSNTKRGCQSIRVYDLNGEQSEPPRRLPEYRRHAWRSLQVHVVGYDHYRSTDQPIEAEEVAGEIRRAPHSTVLVDLIRVSELPNAHHFIRVPGCLEAIGRRPEIGEWIAGW